MNRTTTPILQLKRHFVDIYNSIKLFSNYIIEDILTKLQALKNQLLSCKMAGGPVHVARTVVLDIEKDI